MPAPTQNNDIKIQIHGHSQGSIRNPDNSRHINNSPSKNPHHTPQKSKEMSSLYPKPLFSTPSPTSSSSQTSIQTDLVKILEQEFLEDQILTQQREGSNLQNTVYLDEPPNSTNTKLVPPQNPFPKHVEKLVHFTIHRVTNTSRNTSRKTTPTSFKSILAPIPESKETIHNHIQLPRSLMPILDRTFLPSRKWHLENIYDTSISTEVETKWVIFPMTFYHECGVPDDFFRALDNVLESRESGSDRCFIVEESDSGKIPAHAFWVQVRGWFRDERDVFDAVRCQVGLLRWLVKGGYVVLGLEVLGAGLGFVHESDGRRMSLNLDSETGVEVGLLH